MTEAVPLKVQGANLSGPLARVLPPLPYILLGIATTLALLNTWQTDEDRLVTGGLAAATAVWILGMYTLPPKSWRRRAVPMVIYVAVQLTLAGILMSRQPIFFAFAVIGFVQAYEILPPVPAFISVGVTSILINLTVGGVPTTLDWWVISGTVICLQTFLIGWFGLIGYRYNVQSEQRLQTAAALQAAQEENAGLHAQLVAQAREAGIHDERQRMAREIHDTLAQGLTGIITQLQAADRVREQPDLWQHHMDQVNLLARESLAAARRSVAALGPPELEDSRLPEAIGDLAAKWSQTSGVPVRVETTGEPKPIMAEIEVTLFRVAQEALANVAKHANAGKVAVTLSYLEDLVMLDVRDNGTGFELAEVPEPGAVADGSGFGLLGIRQRLARVAGTLEIETAPGEGTTVNASVPALPALTSAADAS